MTLTTKLDERGPPWVQLGDCLLIHGDCLEVLPLIEAGSVDAVVTSPPYGQQRDYGAPIENWDALMCGTFGSVPASANCQMLVNLGMVHRDGEVITYWDRWLSFMRLNQWRLFGWYVWDQGFGLPGDWNGRLAPSHEFVFHLNQTSRDPNKTVKTLQRPFSGGGLRQANGEVKGKSSPHLRGQPFKIPDSVIRTYREMKRENEHPAVFPVSLPTLLVRSYTSPGQMVVEPFSGSATTAVACLRTGRKCIAIEKEAKYFQIGVERVRKELERHKLFEPPPVVVQSSLWESEP